MTVLLAWFGHVTVIMQRQFQQFVVFLVLQFSSSTEWWTFLLHADPGTHSAHCTADRGDLTVTVLGMVVDAPVAVQRQVLWSGCAETVEPSQLQSSALLVYCGTDASQGQYLIVRYSWGDF